MFLIDKDALLFAKCNIYHITTAYLSVLIAFFVYKTLNVS